MKIRLTNLAFFTFLGLIVGGLMAPSCGTECVLLGHAIGGGTGLLIGCLLNLKVPPTTPRDNTSATDPLVE